MTPECKLTLVAIALVVASCAPKEPRDDSPAPSPTTDKIGVVEVTNYPLEYVVSRLGSPLFEVRFRASEATDPAYWKPTTEDILAMQESDLIVVNGATYESWMNNVSLPASRVVDTTAAVTDRLIPLKDAVTHSHGPEGVHEHSGTAFTTWLDASLLEAQSVAVERAMSERWPDHAGQFASRLVDLQADLEKLDAELAEAARSFEGKKVVFSHPVYQYLQARYGLEGTSVHFEPGLMPDETQFAELALIVSRDGVRWMIWEDAPTPETVARLESFGVKSIVFSPLASRPGSGDYLDAMRRNLMALTTLR